MLAVLSPAKKLDFEPVENIPFSRPEFQSQANELVAVARALSSPDLQKLMKISTALADLNKMRFRTFAPASDDLNSKQAVLAFAGDTYIGLEAGSLDRDEMAYAQDHLRILSGLYGVLRPLDRIQPYRLEMGSRLANGNGRNLYAFWGDRIGQALDRAADGGDVINLASSEYFKAANAGKMTSRVITPAFKEERDGALKMIGLFAKRARGAMARFLVQNRVDCLEGLKDFDAGGYRFRVDLSTETTPVFTRNSTK